MTAVSRVLARAHLRSFLSGWPLLAGVVVLLGALPLEAQVAGRLKRLGKDALKNAAKDKAEGKDSSAATTGAATAPGAARASTASADYTITEERVAAVLAALAPAAERARIVVAANAERPTFEARKEKFEQCLRPFNDAKAMPSAANMAAAEKAGARNDAWSARMSKALGDKDARTVTYVEDSLRVGTGLAMAAIYGATKTCGTPPYAPNAYLEAIVMQREAEMSGTNTAQLEVTDPALSLLSLTQFGMIRERLALFAMLKGGLVPDNKVGKEGVFTDAELAVLEARGAELVKLAPLFQGKALQWTSTSDLRGW